MRELRHFATGKSNSLQDWFKAKNPLLIAFNFLVIGLSKVLPSLALKRFFLRLTGMKIGKNASIGLGVQLDIFFPELIELKDNCLLGYNVTVLCHEFLLKEYRTGRVVIGENAMVGANSTILPGVSVGRNASVSAMSLVNRDVRDNERVEGVPIKSVKK